MLGKDYLSDISIHASLAGGDGITCDGVLTEDISIHASLAGGDAQRLVKGFCGERFQSTPPLREATATA